MFLKYKKDCSTTEGVGQSFLQPLSFFSKGGKYLQERRKLMPNYMIIICFFVPILHIMHSSLCIELCLPPLCSFLGQRTKLPSRHSLSGTPAAGRSGRRDGGPDRVSPLSLAMGSPSVPPLAATRGRSLRLGGNRVWHRQSHCGHRDGCQNRRGRA